MRVAILISGRGSNMERLVDNSKINKNNYSRRSWYKFILFGFLSIFLLFNMDSPKSSTSCSHDGSSLYRVVIS